MIRDVINIENLIANYGEEAAQALLFSFSCERDGIQKNLEVESFVRKNAIDFYKRKLAVNIFGI